MNEMYTIRKNAQERASRLNRAIDRYEERKLMNGADKSLMATCYEYAERLRKHADELLRTAQELEELYEEYLLTAQDNPMNKRYKW